MHSRIKLIEKRNNLLSLILKALLLQKEALSRRDEDAVVMYSEYIRIRMESLDSLKKVMNSVMTDFAGDEFSLSEKAVSDLMRHNIDGIRKMLEEINRQILSCRLLKKSNSLYSSVSKPEHINILQ